MKKVHHSEMTRERLLKARPTAAHRHSRAVAVCSSTTTIMNMLECTGFMSQANRPLVIIGITDKWPAFERWQRATFIKRHVSHVPPHSLAPDAQPPVHQPQCCLREMSRTNCTTTEMARWKRSSIGRASTTWVTWCTRLRDATPTRGDRTPLPLLLLPLCRTRRPSPQRPKCPPHAASATIMRQVFPYDFGRTKRRLLGTGVLYTNVHPPDGARFRRGHRRAAGKSSVFMVCRGGRPQEMGDLASRGGAQAPVEADSPPFSVVPSHRNA